MTALVAALLILGSVIVGLGIKLAYNLPRTPHEHQHTEDCE